MAKASDSKEKTLAAATKLFCRRGYHGTAMHDILSESGAPRGSLYFHFPGGKEEIAEGAVALGAQNCDRLRDHRQGGARRLCDVGTRHRKGSVALRHEGERSRKRRDRDLEPARRRAVAGANVSKSCAYAACRTSTALAGQA